MTPYYSILTIHDPPGLWHPVATEPHHTQRPKKRKSNTCKLPLLLPKAGGILG